MRAVVIIALVLLSLVVFITGCEKENPLSTSASPSEKYVIDQTSCIGCAQCVEACPHNAIHVEGGVATIIQSRCQRCGLCVNACPQSAIQ